MRQPQEPEQRQEPVQQEPELLLFLPQAAKAAAAITVARTRDLFI